MPFNPLIGMNVPGLVPDATANSIEFEKLKALREPRRRQEEYLQALEQQFAPQQQQPMQPQMQMQPPQLQSMLPEQGQSMVPRQGQSMMQQPQGQQPQGQPAQPPETKGKKEAPKLSSLLQEASIKSAKAAQNLFAKFPEKAQKLQAFSQKQSKLATQMQADETKRQLTTLGPIAEKWAMMSPQQKSTNYPSVMRMLQQQGIPTPSSWGPEYDPNSGFDSDMNRTSDVYRGQIEAKRNRGGITKFQKDVDKDGNFIKFNPSTGTLGPILDAQGNKIKASEVQKYFEDEQGNLHRIGSRDTKGAPKSVGFKTAAAKSRQISMAKANIDIKKLNFDIDKSVRLAKEGGQYKANQYQASTYGLRMSEAENIMTNLKSTGFNPTTITLSLLNKGPEFFKSGPLKEYAQAKRSFINATLRRESGAAISQDEFDGANKQYFAQVSDSPKLLKQKKRNREIVQASMRAEAGGAWNETNTKLREVRAPKKTGKKKISKSDSDLLNEYGIK